ncbi:MAG TPA: SH3 domain-containing protein [Bacteroidales bacterium]|mgnify:CR=1 FL=1|nr:SH3 domain-containing protein [Bacteroidales bacterium]HPF02460.1 SH3 domain-containing protein [Bacteroidales bacterium]HPJ59994.1 SH3 domain-containing protein [Bacteroidales bacterium]HPR12917.1 SH3 domain-containing protein [Bacteroidales bacterium]HRW86652.1 SH3 domain-containing protein [Bacteroidales bacterium]
MGLFDKLSKAVTTAKEKTDYNTLVTASGIKATDLKYSMSTDGILTVSGIVADGATREAIVAALKKAEGVKEVKSLLEAEDLTEKRIMMKVVTRSSNLNIRKGPGTEFDIVGKAAHHSNVQLLKKTYPKWYLIKSENGIEGYCSTDYLAQV